MKRSFDKYFEDGVDIITSDKPCMTYSFDTENTARTSSRIETELDIYSRWMSHGEFIIGAVNNPLG